MLRCAPRGPASPTRGNRVCVSRGGRRLGYERQAQIRTDCFLSRVFGGRATAAFRALLVRILVRSRAPLEARRREQERRPTRRRGNVSGLAPLAPCFSGSRPWWRGAGTPRANNKHVASCSHHFACSAWSCSFIVGLPFFVVVFVLFFCFLFFFFSFVLFLCCFFAPSYRVFRAARH